jgi:superfamily II DNA or RNA helicase
MKTILSTRGYKIPKKHITNEQLQLINKDLIINPYTFDMTGFKDKDKEEDNSYAIYSESEKYYVVPRYWGEQNFGPPVENRIPPGLDIDVEFKGQMRDYQLDIVDKYMKEVGDQGGSIVNLKTGGGKTVLALYIISLLKKKTIILVHKSFLADQWSDRIREFIPNVKITKVQGTKSDWSGDIVIAMIQTILNREIPPDITNELGFLIADECHHLAAKMFAKSLIKLNPRYHMGLSATVKRADSLQRIFEYYLGEICFRSQVDKKTNVEVRLLSYECQDPRYCKTEKLWNGKICRPRIINNICAWRPRTDYIMDVIYKCYDMGRKILILSDRREHCLEIVKLSNTKYGEDIAGAYLGGMKINELDESNQKMIIAGTYQACSEGYDNKTLDTLIMSTPISNIEQTVGRILRQDNQFHPLIYSIVDENISCLKKNTEKHLTLFKRRDYDVYKNDDPDKIDFKKIKKKVKEKNMWDQECLL